MNTKDSIVQYSVENAVFESSPEAIVVLDKIGKIIRVNPRLYEWVGYSQDELVGRHLLQLPFIVPESKKVIVKKFLSRMAGNRIDPYLIHCLSKNGQKKIGKVRARVIKDERSRIIGEVAMIEEVTQEEEYRQLAQTRDEIIEAVGYAADQFLRSKNWKNELPRVLHRLGQASSAERVFLIHLRPNERQIAPQGIDMWSEKELSVSSQEEMFSHQSIEKVIESHLEKFKKDTIVHLDIKSQKKVDKLFLESGGRQSSVMLPLFLGERFWGILGFDDIQLHLEMSKHEYESLVLARNILQGAIQRWYIAEAINKRDKILSITNDFNHSFNIAKKWQQTLSTYLQKLGVTLDAEYLRYCPSADITDTQSTQMSEWKSESLPNDFTFAYDSDCFQKCIKDFQNEQPFSVTHCTLQQHTGKFSAPWAKPFSQYMIIPVGEGESLWGLLFIGAVDHQVPWSEVERSALKLFCRVMGSIFTKQKSFLELERRERILTAVSTVAKHFLKYETWQQDMPKILKKIGSSISASQVVLAINDLNQRVYEWCVDDSSGCSSADVFQHVIQGKGPFGRWKSVLKNGECVHLKSDTDSIAIKKYFAKQLAKSVLIIPFFVKGKWWGLLAVLHREDDHTWSPSELKSFQIATDIISAAIQNNLTELELRKTVEYWKQEERKVEEEVEEKQKFQLAVSGSSDAVVMTTLEPKIIYVNPAWEKLTKYTLEEAIGKNPKILQSGKTVQRIYKDMWGKLTHGDSFFSDEIVNKRKDGTEYPARLTVYPVRKNNKNVFYVGIQQDITELKKVEQLKTDFISIASHQMNTPLSALRWMLELYQKKYFDILKGQQKDMIGEMYESTLRMIDLITSLLNIARVESGRMMVEISSIDFNTVVEETMADVQSFADKKSITLQLKSRLKHSKISADSKILKHIVTNLLSNAIKYSPKKGVVTIRLARKNDIFEFHVYDQGVGIPPSEQDRIFTKFYRASNVVHKEVDGSGLGLYLVKILVESFGGEISFENSKGGGTHFWFTLPAKGMRRKSGEVTLAEGMETQDKKM